MTVYLWSTAAADNDDADTSVNARENQSPSTYNDAVRAAMAAVAKWRDDISGKLVTAGTSTAYTLTTNQVFTSLIDGMMVTARMSATSGAAPTLNVDSRGAKAIQLISGTAIPTGLLISGGIYSFQYRASTDTWIVILSPATHGIPAAEKMLFYKNAAPSGWTQDTSINDATLRIVDDDTGGSTGGTAGFTTVFAARTIVAANLPNMTLTVTDPGHEHDTDSTHGVTNIAGGGLDRVVDLNGTTSEEVTGISVAIDDTARGGSQTAMDFAVKYANWIIATKDAYVT